MEGARWTRGESSTFEIVAIEALAEQAGTVALALGGITVGGRAGGVAARVVVKSDPGSLAMGVSKLDGESEWIVDSLGVEGCCPYWANGVGSRCTALKSVQDAELVAALDAAAAGVAA